MVSLTFCFGFVWGQLPASVEQDSGHLRFSLPSPRAAGPSPPRGGGGCCSFLGLTSASAGLWAPIARLLLLPGPRSLWALPRKCWPPSEPSSSQSRLCCLPQPARNVSFLNSRGTVMVRCPQHFPLSTQWSLQQTGPALERLPHSRRPWPQRRMNHERDWHALRGAGGIARSPGCTRQVVRLSPGPAARPCPPAVQCGTATRQQGGQGTGTETCPSKVATESE